MAKFSLIFTPPPNISAPRRESECAPYFNSAEFEADQLQVPAFREAARTLQPGEISPPLKTQYGFHLVRLEERRDPRQFTLAEDWQQIHEMALNAKGEKEFQTWVAALKKQMYIRVASLE